MTKIILNGVEVEADPKKPLIHACQKELQDVPTYCYHPGLSAVGSCRMCQVEVKQGEAPARVVVACRTPVAEGMIVNTEAPKAHETRRECLEFILKNHPLDCPICDKAGECDLQDFAFSEGQGQSQSHEDRRQLEKRKDLGETILLDQERCVQCSRCVRFFEEVTEKAQLTCAERGSHAVIDTFMGKPLEGNYQGNVADLCPVGALTLKPFRFQARVWNLQKVASTCMECSRGCSTTVEVLRGQDVKRIRPRFNQDVNNYWMCDHGRFAIDAANPTPRLETAVLRDATHGWERLDNDTALESAREALMLNNPSCVIVSPFATQEEARAALSVAEALGVKAAFVSPAESELKDDLLHTGDPCPNRRGLEEAGFAAITPEEALEQLTSAKSAALIGERVCELVGSEALAGLPSSLRLVVFDVAAPDSPAARVCIPVPNWVEKSGTVINIDGHIGTIAAARSAPAGVRPLEANLVRLSSLLKTTEVQA